MKPPKFAGKIIYFFGYPLFRLLINGTTRAYVAVCFNDEILLTQNWLGFQKKWRLSGGGVDGTETPTTAAIRELQEELGLVIQASDLQLLSSEPIKSRFNYKYYLFVYIPPLKPAIIIDEREIIRAEFIQKAVLKDHHLSEESTAALRLLGWL